MSHRCRRRVRSREHAQCRPWFPRHRERREPLRDASPSPVAAPRMTLASSGERIVELAPRHRLRSATVAQPARLLSRMSSSASAITGKTSLVGERLRHPFPARIGESDEVPGQIAAIDRRYISGLERPQIPRVVPVVEMAAEARESAHGRQRRLQPLDRVDRSRSIRNRARSPPTADRGRYWSATSGAPRTGVGSSWKLSGGNMWSAGVTKVSKKRHVRRAISRKARASPSRHLQMAARRDGDRLAQRAIAGEAIQSAANGSASGHVPCPHAEATTSATAPMRTAAGHPAIEAEKVELGARSSPAPRSPIRADAGG